MPDTYSGNYNFVMPEPGGSIDTWGTKLNSNWRTLDQILGEIAANAERALEGAPRGMLAFMAISQKTMAQLKKPSNVGDLIVQPGWMLCNGDQMNTNTSYWNDPALDALRQLLINQGYPYGRNNENPRVPNPRGMVLRAADLGAGVDPDGDRAFGNAQQDTFKSHSHSARSGSAGGHNHGGYTGYDTHDHGGRTGADGSHTHDASYRLKVVGRGDYGQYFDGDSWEPGTFRLKDIITTAPDHRHSISSDTHRHTIANESAHTHPITVDSTGDRDETRMKNMCFALCIRY